MPLASPKYEFRKAVISGAPDDPGVYALYKGGELLCIGIALGKGDDTIKSRLLAHLGAQRIAATHYQWEISSDPMVRRAQIISGLSKALAFCEEKRDSA